jgi:hypothetical protein
VETSWHAAMTSTAISPYLLHNSKPNETDMIQIHVKHTNTDTFFFASSNLKLRVDTEVADLQLLSHLSKPLLYADLSIASLSPLVCYRPSQTSARQVGRSDDDGVRVVLELPIGDVHRV